jgi:hypothetical protein
MTQRYENLFDFQLYLGLKYLLDMKRVVKLTESDLEHIVRRVIREQALGGLLDMPETGQDVIGVGPINPIGCKTYKSSSELVLELFGKLRSVSGQPNQSDKTIQSWVQRLSNSMNGLGASNDLTKVFTEIKTQQQMGSVLNAYNKKFGRTLYQDLSGEHTISWDTIWSLVKKFKTGIKIEMCKAYHQSPTLSA